VSYKDKLAQISFFHGNIELIKQLAIDLESKSPHRKTLASAINDHIKEQYALKYLFAALGEVLKPNFKPPKALLNHHYAICNNISTLRDAFAHGGNYLVDRKVSMRLIAKVISNQGFESLGRALDLLSKQQQLKKDNNAIDLSRDEDYYKLAVKNEDPNSPYYQPEYLTLQEALPQIIRYFDIMQSCLGDISSIDNIKANLQYHLPDNYTDDDYQKFINYHAVAELYKSIRRIWKRIEPTEKNILLASYQNNQGSQPGYKYLLENPFRKFCNNLAHDVHIDFTNDIGRQSYKMLNAALPFFKDYLTSELQVELPKAIRVQEAIKPSMVNVAELEANVNIDAKPRQKLAPVNGVKNSDALLKRKAESSSQTGKENNIDTEKKTTIPHK